MQVFGLGFSILVALFALKRAVKIYFWGRTEGVVVGPIGTMGDSSGVLVSFMGPDGVVREFPSSIHFGHRYKAPEGERIPFAKGQKVAVLYNPRNFDQAELNTPLLFIIPIALLLMSAALAYILLN